VAVVVVAVVVAIVGGGGLGRQERAQCREGRRAGAAAEDLPQAGKPDPGDGQPAQELAAGEVDVALREFAPYAFQFIRHWAPPLLSVAGHWDCCSTHTLDAVASTIRLAAPPCL